MGWSYTYDANKNLASAATGGVMQPYSFTTAQDDADRLVQWDRTNQEAQQWALTLVGDWQQFQGQQLEASGLAPFNETRTYNPVHEDPDTRRRHPARSLHPAPRPQGQP